MIVVVDTDAMIAIANPSDPLNTRALLILDKLSDIKSQVLILPTTLSEFALLAKSRLGLIETQMALRLWTEIGKNYILEINHELTKEAINRFHEQTSKNETLFDCFVMAAAKEYKADCIFSFDQGYKKAKNNFKLAEDVL
jgi:predicted nucleic acid-binding protein